MRTDTNLQFISNKISQLRNAIMYSMSTEPVKFPNSIVTAVKVDDEGQLWFLCDKPGYHTDQCPQSFPVRLHFYRKGMLFHIEVSGSAEVVNNDYKGINDHNKPLLLRMDMWNIAYTEATENRKNKLENWLEKFYKWLVKNITVSRNPKPVLRQLSTINHS